jgi:hypothetical protein
MTSRMFFGGWLYPDAFSGAVAAAELTFEQMSLIAPPWVQTCRRQRELRPRNSARRSELA